MTDNTSRKASTRRDTIKYGGAVITGGLLAGCAGQGDGGSTPTETDTPTDAESGTDTPTETHSD